MLLYVQIADCIQATKDYSKATGLTPGALVLITVSPKVISPERYGRRWKDIENPGESH